MIWSLQVKQPVKTFQEYILVSFWVFHVRKEYTFACSGHWSRKVFVLQHFLLLKSHTTNCHQSVPPHHPCRFKYFSAVKCGINFCPTSPRNVPVSQEWYVWINELQRHGPLFLYAFGNMFARCSKMFVCYISQRTWFKVNWSRDSVNWLKSAVSAADKMRLRTSSLFGMAEAASVGKNVANKLYCRNESGHTCAWWK